VTATARDHAADEVLKDGGSIHARASASPRLFHRLSARSVYFRFFGAERGLTDAELNRFDFPTIENPLPSTCPAPSGTLLGTSPRHVGT
jgi:hypothetical protein